MAFAHSPKIVTDGLVLALDAGNPKSYASGSTTWRDKSGNGYDGTLTNGPTFSSDNGGAIVFDGSNDNVKLAGTPIDLPQGITMQCIIRPTTTSTDQIYLQFNSFGHYLRRKIDNLYVSLEINADQKTTASGNVPADTYSIVVATYDNINIKLYMNGTLIRTQSQPGSLTNTKYPFTDRIGNIGTFNDGSYRYQGDVSNVQIYNRALSASEVQQNYNALKGRFGI
jgi:hypothetical protein